MKNRLHESSIIICTLVALQITCSKRGNENVRTVLVWAEFEWEFLDKLCISHFHTHCLNMLQVRVIRERWYQERCEQSGFRHTFWWNKTFFAERGCQMPQMSGFTWTKGTLTGTVIARESKLLKTFQNHLHFTDSKDSFYVISKSNNYNS